MGKRARRKNAARPAVEGSAVTSAKRVYLRIAAMLANEGIQTTVTRIPQREQACSREVAALPFHYRADFERSGHRVSLELSTAEPTPPPTPALFLLQVSLSSLVCRISGDFTEWRAIMGSGPPEEDLSIYLTARQQAEALAALLPPDRLQMLEQLALEQLGPPDDETTS